MENGNLRSFLRSRRPGAGNSILSTALLQNIARKCTAAVSFLKRHNLVHRNLAAKEFLVGSDETDIRLADFGKARDIYEVS